MKERINLVLSGGGARGLAHIGVIREIESRGYDIASIVGTSIGALVGAMYVQGKLQEFAAFLEKQNQESIMRLMDFTLSGHGLIRGKRFFDELQKIAPDRNIEDIPIPITIIASDLITGREVAISSGSLYQAVRASVAIPTIIKPIYKNGMILVDGGVTNPFPLNHVICRHKDECTIGVNLYAIDNPKDAQANFQNERNTNKSLTSLWLHLAQLRDWKKNLVDSIFTDTGNDFNYAGTFRRMSELMNGKMAQQSARLYPPDITINIPLNAAGLFDFHLSKELNTLGRFRASRAIDRYEAYTSTLSYKLRRSLNLWRKS